jgi:probable rRNA maturation factor
MDFPEPNSLGGSKQGSYDLGEILICWPQLRRQAKEYGWSNEIEFARLLVHGLAHLSGYDHENVSKVEARKMTDFEQSVLNKLKIKFDA